MFRPGIRVLFSGKTPAEYTPAERVEIATVTRASGAMVAVIVVVVALGAVAMSGIIAAIAVPVLLRARMAGNEAMAIGSMRGIGSAQAAYFSVPGGYATRLATLGIPCRGRSQVFITRADAGSVCQEWLQNHARRCRCRGRARRLQRHANRNGRLRHSDAGAAIHYRHARVRRICCRNRLRRSLSGAALPRGDAQWHGDGSEVNGGGCSVTARHRTMRHCCRPRPDHSRTAPSPVGGELHRMQNAECVPVAILR